jgi:adenylate cyclase class IV
MKITLDDLNEIGAYVQIEINNNFNDENIKYICIHYYDKNDNLIDYRTLDLNKFKNIINFLNENI